jgi:hypothetical protein
MVAIALAESGGNTDAHALTSREDSRGLWQINVRAHPQYATSNLYDPAVNANAAKDVLARQGFGAWSVWTGGKSLLYMPVAGAAVGSLPAGSKVSENPLADPVGAAAGPVGNVVGGVKDVAASAGNAVELAQKAGTWISNPQNMLRVLYVILGGALLVGALVVVVAPVASEVAGGVAGQVVKGAVKQ